MTKSAPKTASVYTGVNPETKEPAEATLNHLWITFEMEFSSVKPIAIGGMTKNQINDELQKGMEDVAADRTVSADEIETEMWRLYGI